MSSEEQLSVTYASSYDARDINSFKGIPYHLIEHLKRLGHKVEYACPLENQHKFLTKWKRRFYDYLLNKDYMPYLDKRVIKDYERQIKQKVKRTDGDVLLSTEPQVIAHKSWDMPSVLYVDCLMKQMDGYYFDACKESLRNGLAVNRQGLRAADHVVCTTEWAADAAVNDYATPASKVSVIPFGANLPCNHTAEDIQSFIDQRSDQICQLLFVGLDWSRKGGDVALEVTRQLRERSVQAELTVVGCTPDLNGPTPSFVRTKGFIDKKSDEGLQQLQSLFGRSHFLIMPSRAETFGIVYAEANSFGVPCIASTTGGVPSVVRDHQNGFTFPLDGADKMTQCIHDLFEDKDTYKRLAMKAFEEYQNRLNWLHTAREFSGLFQKLVTSGSAH